MGPPLQENNRLMQSIVHIMNGTSVFFLGMLKIQERENKKDKNLFLEA